MQYSCHTLKIPKILKTAVGFSVLKTQTVLGTGKKLGFSVPRTVWFSVLINWYSRSQDFRDFQGEPTILHPAVVVIIILLIPQALLVVIMLLLILVDPVGILAMKQ